MPPEPEGPQDDRPPADEKLILVVDDDEGVRELLAHLLFTEGFQIEAAADGKEAMERIGERDPDLVILDLMLPGQGGYEVLRRLQEGETARRIPVLVITARSIDQTTEAVIRQESNVRGFVRKPFESEAMIQEFHKLLGTRPSSKIGRKPSK